MMQKGMQLAKGINTFAITVFTLAILGIFLSPFVFMVFTSLKTQEQITIVGAPIYPAAPSFFEYEGEELEVFSLRFLPCRCPTAAKKTWLCSKKGARKAYSLIQEPWRRLPGKVPGGR
jgi:ABC-type glycerol-3-phosphate transport system permease component